MSIEVTKELAQIETAISHLNEIKYILSTKDPLRILNLFSSMKEKKIHLSHYFTDNRELLTGISEYLNAAVAGSNFAFSLSPMQTNSTRLNVLHHTRHVGELNLSNNYVHLHSHFFHLELGNQTHIENLERRIQSEAETIARLERELMKLKHSSPLKLKLINIRKTHLLQMEDNLKNRKTEHEITKQELRTNNETIYGWWETALTKFQDHKSFIQQIEKLGFTHNFKGLVKDKNYQMFYRKETNHSHSSFLSFEQNHISILSSDEWDLKDLDRSNWDSFYFTSEEFEFLFDQIENEPELGTVRRDSINGIPCLIVDFDLGLIAISKKGFVAVKGEDLNLFYLIRYPSIRKALYLLYKERSHEDFLQALK